MKSLLTTILLTLLLFTAGNTYAQSDSYVLLEKSTMTIEGTSTIHDWEADVQEMQATIDMNISALEADTMQSPVNSLTLSVPVKSIESGKGGMNRKIYGALKDEEHPNITFELTGTELIQSNAQATNGSETSFQLMANGNLTIAGSTREVSFPVDAYIQDGDTYQFTGSYELNMKDYDVDPPSAVFGTIKSGEVVTILFDTYFSKE